MDEQPASEKDKDNSMEIDQQDAFMSQYDKKKKKVCNQFFMGLV